MPKTLAQKKAQKVWIEKNREVYDEKQRIHALTYYYNNREEILAQKKLEYQNKKNKKTQSENVVQDAEVQI
jgi:hypothetical protein